MNKTNNVYKIIILIILCSSCTGLIASSSPNFEKNKQFFEAIKNQDIDLAKQLIQEGADINATHPINPTGDTPLIYAVRFGNAALVTLLLENGANPNQQNYNTGAFPLDLALGSEPEQIDIALLLLEHGAHVADIKENIIELYDSPEGALLVSIEENQKHLFYIALELGADVNTTDDQGNTPLLNAVLNNKYDFVRALLDLGADKYKKNINDQSAWSFRNDPGIAPEIRNLILKSKSKKYFRAPLKSKGS